MLIIMTNYMWISKIISVLGLDKEKVITRNKKEYILVLLDLILNLSYVVKVIN
jgi:hypothetical protein